MRSARGWASLTSSLQDGAADRLGPFVRQHADGAGTGAVGVGWNSLSFSSTSFGQPATTLGQGLPYNLADIFAVNYDPGIRPQAGQINNPPTYMDRNAGRPPRINQWNIAVQRELTKNLAVEAAYVGNHGVWLQSSSSWDLNALTPQRIAAAGLNINNAADRTLLTSPLNSATGRFARGFKLPYAGFPTTLTVAQSLRPYPQFGSLVEMWAPRETPGTTLCRRKPRNGRRMVSL
jgi:hypothetical protein